MSVPDTARALMFVLALCCATQARPADQHWSYREHGGAVKWGELDRSFANCKLGKVQSPIDIRDATPADLPAIKFDYEPSPLKIVKKKPTIEGGLKSNSFLRRAGGDKSSMLHHSMIV